MLNNENMDNFTALYTLCLCFASGTISMQATFHDYGIYVFLYKSMLFEFRVKHGCRDCRSCMDCLGQSKLSWGVYMQELLDSQSNYLGVLAQLWKIWLNTISVGLTCSHAFSKSSFSQTNTINWFSQTLVTYWPLTIVFNLLKYGENFMVLQETDHL